MKRLSLIGSWKRLGVQAGLLAGIGLAFVGGTEPPRLEAAPKNCQLEGECTFKKPLFGIILDYSTSMNTMFDANITRWQGAVNAIKIAVNTDNGYLAENFILGLVRFGHDPAPGQAGTKIMDDASGIVDGQKLDVPWYNEADPAKKYYECTNGDAIIAALDALPAPINGKLTGIGTWTKGALDFTKAYIAKTKADHPADMGERLAVLMVVTDGEWTDPTGTMKLAPATQDPKITAGDLFMNQQIKTYVVAIGEAQGKMFADQLAMAGGTNAAIDAVDPQALINALKDVIEEIKQTVVAPVCTPGLPRIMVLLDASSSMLNENNKHAPMNTGGWDQARDALAGANSIFDIEIGGDPKKKVENLVHLGLAVFGHNSPAEEKLIVQYGPCRKDNFGWALDPATSCDVGCNDPYGPPTIKWTFKDGSKMDPPGFDEKTVSHMPKCDASAQLPGACVGSGTYTHLGLNLVQSNIASYKAECKVDGYIYPCSDDTEFINIIVTDGDYNSTDAQVKAPLEAMFNAGITTYVIGFGDLVDSPASIAKLNNMADWGSGNAENYYDANNQDQLEMALADIIGQLTFDPCCQFNDCAFSPEPTTIEMDPVPPEEGGNESSSSSSSGGDESSSSGVVDPSTSTTDGTTEPVDPSTTSSTTVDPSTTNPSTDPTTTDDTVDPTTGPTPTTTTVDPTNDTPATTPATPGGDESSDTELPDSVTATDTDVTGQMTDDEGCGCKVEDGQGSTRGLLGTLLTFGLAGFIRRRRRA